MLDYSLIILSSIYQMAVILFVLKEFGFIMAKKQETVSQGNASGVVTAQSDNPMSALLNGLGPMMEKMMSSTIPNQAPQKNDNNVKNIAETD